MHIRGAYAKGFPIGESYIPPMAGPTMEPHPLISLLGEFYASSPHWPWRKNFAEFFSY